MSSQLQQLIPHRINFISTFLSQQFWAGFGSGRARWVSASLVSALSSWIPKTRCQQKIAISKILNRKYLNKNSGRIIFQKNVISYSTITFFGINIDLLSMATVLSWVLLFRMLCFLCLLLFVWFVLSLFIVSLCLFGFPLPEVFLVYMALIFSMSGLLWILFWDPSGCYFVCASIGALFRFSFFGVSAFSDELCLHCW